VGGQPSWNVNTTSGVNATDAVGIGMGITAPTVADPELQAAINSIAGRFNVLVAQRNFLNGAPGVGEASTATTPGAMTAESGIHNKENESVGSESAMEVDMVEQGEQQMRKENSIGKEKKSTCRYMIRVIRCLHAFIDFDSHSTIQYSSRNYAYLFSI
jgi:hypothetical protein